MTTPILRTITAAQITQGLGAVNNLAYSTPMRIQTSALSFQALLADFRIPAPTFSGAVTGGAVQLIAVDRDFAGNMGTAPSATNQGRVCGTFNPIFTGTATPGLMSLNSIPLSPDADYYVYNNGTGFNIATGITMVAQPWSPGT